MNAPFSMVRRMAVHDGAAVPAPSLSCEVMLPCAQPGRGSGSCCSPGAAGRRCQGASGASGLREGLCGAAELARADARGGSVFPEQSCAAAGAAAVCCLPQLQVTRALGRR